MVVPPFGMIVVQSYVRMLWTYFPTFAALFPTSPSGPYFLVDVFFPIVAVFFRGPIFRGPFFRTPSSVPIMILKSIVLASYYFITARLLDL